MLKADEIWGFHATLPFVQFVTPYVYLPACTNAAPNWRDFRVIGIDDIKICRKIQILLKSDTSCLVDGDVCRSTATQ